MTHDTKALGDRFLADLANVEEPIAKSTIHSYRSMMNRLASECPTLPCSPRAFKCYLEGTGGKVALRTAQRRYDAANRFFKSESVRNLGIRNLCDSVARPRETAVMEARETGQEAAAAPVPSASPAAATPPAVVPAAQVPVEANQPVVDRKEVELETELSNRGARVQAPKKGKAAPPSEVVSTREKVDEHLEIIRKDKDLKANTLANYRRSLHRFAAVVPTLPPDPDEIEDQIRAVLGDPEEYKTSTRRQRYIALNQFFTSKIGRKLGLRDLLQDIPIPKKGESRIVILSQEELKLLVNAVETDQERALVYLLIHTGIRIGETKGMKVSHIKNDELTVTGKTGPRGVTLQPEMERMLRDLANAAGDIWWDDDGALSLDQIEYRYQKVAKRAGISELALTRSGTPLPPPGCAMVVACPSCRRSWVTNICPPPRSTCISSMMTSAWPRASTLQPHQWAFSKVQGISWIMRQEPTGFPATATLETSPAFS